MRLRSRSDSAVRWLRVGATVLGLPLIVGGLLVTITEANARRRDDRYRALSTEAAQKSARLGDYFSRAHDLILVAAENPSLRDFFALPGDRATRVAAGGKVIDDVQATLRTLHALYPDSIGEICYIDRGGAEIARLVHEVAAAPTDLSPDERGNQFFSSTIGLPPGQVFQEAPYLSPDTHTCRRHRPRGPAFRGCAGELPFVAGRGPQQRDHPRIRRPNRCGDHRQPVPAASRCPGRSTDRSHLRTTRRVAARGRDRPNGRRPNRVPTGDDRAEQ
jgi:hypothetical protein